MNIVHGGSNTKSLLFMNLSSVHMCTHSNVVAVELPNNGHIGSGPFVLYIEVVPL